MSRRKRTPEHVSHERWLVSYADFITLLFAFFVVLYASSKVDAKKVAQIAASIQGAFQQLGVFTGSSAAAAKLPPLPKEVSQGKGDTTRVDPSKNITNAGFEVEKLRHELEEALGEQLGKREVEMHVGPEGLVVSLREVGFFKSGEASLLPGAQQTLARIARVLVESGFDIRVEGHTDDRPIHSARFKSNWELSTARATEVVTLLIDHYSFDATHVSVAGYSQFRPVATNRTEEGRASNRRVDLVVVGGRPHAAAAPAKPGM